MSSILVTGATGFVGHHLVASLRDHHDVHCVVREGAHVEGAENHVVDLAQPVSSGQLPEEIDAIIHLAQSRHYREFPERAKDIFRVNVQGTLELLEYARQAGAERFIYTSSGGIYGNSYERLAESHPANPLNFYLTSKYSGELMIGNYSGLFKTVVFRPFFVYGPGQRGMLISNLIERVMDGEPIRVQGDPGVRTNPIYVADMVRALVAALDHDRSAVFNAAGDDAVTLTELVRLIGKATGREPRIEHAATDSSGDLVASNVLMKEELGIAPEVTLDDGLRRTYAAIAEARA